MRAELAQALGVPAERVRVLVPRTGSAYGGKHNGQAAVEAARLARAVGRPVKVHWTRAEEFREAYFRPAAVIDVRSGASVGGRLVAWHFTNHNAGAPGIPLPYECPHQRIVYAPAASPLAQGSYRALAATANNFARESHVDELADRLGADPLQFRLRHLGDDRLAAVLRAVAERLSWRGPRVGGPGRGVGLAVGLEKGGRAATAVEVRVTGGALFESVRFEGRRVLNALLLEYRVPRFSDVPPVEVVLLNRPDLPPADGGETPLIAVAPALANAIFTATGERLRDLPLLGGSAGCAVGATALPVAAPRTPPSGAARRRRPPHDPGPRHGPPPPPSRPRI